MKLPSTMTTVSGSAHHASLRRCAAGIGGRAPSVITRLMRPPRGGPRRGPPHPPTFAAPRGTRGAPRSPAPSCALPGVLLLPVLVQVTAVAIVDDDRRERLHLQPPDRLGAEVLVGDDLQRLHVARQHRPGAADRAEVDAPVLAQRVLHRLAAIALAHRALEAELQER